MYYVSMTVKVDEEHDEKERKETTLALLAFSVQSAVGLALFLTYL